MNVVNLSREKTFFLWSVIGPLLALATVLLMVYHATDLTPYLGLIVILGLPACWYMKKWGLILVSFSLVSLMFFTPEFTQKDLFWHIGLAISIVLTLFVANSSYDEAIELVENFEGSSTSTQETINQYKSEIEGIKFNHRAELQALQKKIDGFVQEIKSEQEKSNLLNDDAEKAHRELQEQRIEMDRVKNDFDSLRVELNAKSSKEEHLLQESLEQRQEILLLRDQLLESQFELKNKAQLPSSTHEEDDSEFETLREMLAKTEQDLFNTQFRLDSTLEDFKTQEQELAKLQNLESMQKKIRHEMSDQIDTLKREKDLLERTLNKLQQEAEHLIAIKQEKEDLEKSFHQLSLKNGELSNVQQEKLHFETITKQLQKEIDQLSSIKDEKRLLEEIINKLQQEAETLSLLKDDKRHLEENINKLQQQVESLSLLKDDKRHLEEVISKLQEETQTLSLLKDDKRHLEENIDKLQQQIEDLSLIKNEKENLADQLKQQFQLQESLKAEKSDLEIRLQTLESELAQINKAIQDTPPSMTADTAQEIAQRKRAEAMYLQLKDQFNEKTFVLDETRRQLFLTQEQLSQLQRMVEENEQFVPNPEVQALIKYTLKMQQKYDRKIKAYESEIDTLHEIISRGSTP